MKQILFGVMKKFLLLAVLAAALVGTVEVGAQERHGAQQQAAAQKQKRTGRKKEPDRREMSIIVIDNKGNHHDYADVFSSIRSADGKREFARVHTDEPLLVAETDTIDLFVNDQYFEFAVAGRGTLFVTINVPDEEIQTDSLTIIEPVLVTAVAPRMVYRAGQLINADAHAGNSTNIPLRRGQTLGSALLWHGLWKNSLGQHTARGKPVIFIIDGSPITTGRPLDYDNIAAITLHRDAGAINMFAGPYGGGANVGAVVEITTKSAAERRRKKR